MEPKPTPASCHRDRDRALLARFNRVVSTFVISMFGLLLLGLLA